MDNNYVLNNDMDKPTASKVLNMREAVNVYLHFFSFYCGQRLKVFSFFLTIEVVLFGAYASLASGTIELLNCQFALIMISLVASAVSIILFSMDRRLLRLIQFTCQAIRKFENTYESEFPQEMRLLTNINTSMKYTDLTVVFTISYGIFFAAGMFLVLVSIIVF